MKVAALQLSSLPLDLKKIEEHVKLCSSKGARLVLIGEYVLNRFFKELVNTPPKMIEKQSQNHIQALKEIANTTEVCIVAPLVVKRGGGFVKVAAKFEKNKNPRYYPQQKFIGYKHWDEDNFFIKPNGEFKLNTFNFEGLKFAVVFGYELHFDEFFLEIKKRGVDVLLLPTASTFDSLHRWREIIRVRAFLNSIYILRANRIGRYKEDANDVWHFYGDTLLCSPEGEICGELGDKEEVLLVLLDKKYIKDVKKLWKFE
ncbi:MAG: carbon-nitrogen hydrolase family protein [Campylobacterales bacterium]